MIAWGFVVAALGLAEPPVDFVDDVVPVFTRLGCNSGACHGKSTGQNGFRLSLLGYNPAFDRESLAVEGRGRRVRIESPDDSLLLLKPTARVKHGGGKRLDAGSPEFATLRQWIAEGATIRKPAKSRWASLEVRPASTTLLASQPQSFRVFARKDDGTEADVTRLARFESTAPDLAEVDPSGRLTPVEGVGELAVVARFAGRLALARVLVPRAGKSPEWASPPPRNLIDRFVFEKLQALGIPPSPACDDGTFARRTSLDLRGILPTPADLAAFEADRDPDKRVAWVDRLLDRPEYADRFAMLWSALLRNRRTLGPLSQPGTFAFHDWIREALAENWPYDKIVTEILTSQGDTAVNPAAVWFREPRPAEQLADDAAQLFLGVRLQCARCHHHPFERWGQDDYEGFAAFFRRVERKPGADADSTRVFVRMMTPEDASPRFLGGPSLNQLDPRDDPRRSLAEWLRRPDNPYFARAVVNRYWKHFLGRGLVDPEDDLRESNPASNPPLLDALADDFVRHGYDLKRLSRMIATSRAYERSSDPVPGNETDRRNFARFAPRRLPAEVLLDAIDTVAGTTESFAGLPKGARAVSLPDEGFDTPDRFLDVFGRPRRESVCDCERSNEPSLAQRLHLLNSEEIERKVRDPKGRAARWAVDTRPDVDKIVELYRIALSRRPVAEESAACLAHLKSARDRGEIRKGFEDLVWAVLNTKEFALVQ